MVIAVLLFILLWSDAGASPRLVIWIAAMTFVQLSRLALYVLFMRTHPGVDRAPAWARIAVAATGTSGIFWGASVLFFFDPASPANLVAMTMAATGIAAGGTAVLSTIPMAYAVFATFHLSPLVVQLAATGDFANLVFAAGFIFFFFILFFTVRTMGATLDESLRLRFERIDMIEHLEAARIHAESASRAKSEFLALMTHELKTPLNAIIGYAALIGSLPGSPRDAKLEAYTSEIHEGARRLLALINDILDLSKADAGKLDLREGIFSIGAAIARCRQLILPRAEDAKIELGMELDDGLPAVRGDERLIRQAVLNLLSNAIKFTPTGGLVRIGARRMADGGVVIEVTDNGIGMSAEDLPRAMEPFEQISRGYARQRAGSGLGLPLAKRIAEIHRGRIEIASQAGDGTTVRLVLPADRVAS